MKLSVKNVIKNVIKSVIKSVIGIELKFMKLEYVS